MKRAVFAAAGLAVLAAGTVADPAAHAALDPGSQYQLSARADAMAVEYLNTAAPVFAENAIIYGTPATAISVLDSVGQSSALAAAPYPGDVMIGMPDNGKGVVAGLGGPAEAVPTYPFFVTSSHPISPDSVQDQSGNRLEAHSRQYTSWSEARSGLITGDVLAALQAQARSSVSVDETTGALAAVADSRLDAFKVTDRLQIGRSTAHAGITREPGQAAAKESSFTIGSITVGDATISYSDEGFQAGDQSPPSQEPPAGFFDSLKPAGITVEFLPASGTDTSIDSAGLRITQVQELGPATQRISFTIGRVSARIDGEASPAKETLLDETLPAADGRGPAGEVPAAAGPAPADGGGAAPAVVGVAADIGDAATATALEPPEPATPDVAVLPPALEAAAASPTRTAPAPPLATAAPAPEVRLASPAALVGRGLRDDDVAGLYAAVGAAALLMALAGFLLPGLARRRVPVPTRSVLRLP